MYWIVALFLTAGSFLGPIVSEEWRDLCPLIPNERDRIGFNFSPLHGEIASDFDVARLHAGWYNDYQIQAEPDRPVELTYVQTLFSGGQSTLSEQQRAKLQTAAFANPGSIWLAGNEPDRVGIQDNMLPADYARYYHEVYTFIKGIDPTARIATAGIVQATSIRLRYLDHVLAAYQEMFGQPMPVDLWNIHNFMLREELNGWGAGIPPGLEAYASEGKLYEVSDNGRIDLFQEQVIHFRRWMAANGYRQTPLIISEFGILMPELYGFPEEKVAQFLTDTFTFLHNATDPDIGYPEDDNRLVQAWSWYSLNERPYDLVTKRGFNGHLYDIAGNRWTAAGQAFMKFTAPLDDKYADPAIASFDLDTGYSIPDGREQVTATVTLVNGGSLQSGTGNLELWLAPKRDGQQVKLGEVQVSSLPSHCRAAKEVSLTISTNLLPIGTFYLEAKFIVDGEKEERDTTNNSIVHEFHLIGHGVIQQNDMWLPMTAK